MHNLENNNPIKGFIYILDGFKLIAKPGIKRFVIVPLLINIIFFIGLFFVSNYFFNHINQWMGSYLPHWLHWIENVLWLIFFIGYSLTMIYFFTTVTNLIAAPFNSFLSEKVEFYLTGKTHQQDFLKTLRDIPRIILRQLAILFYYLPRALLILILFFIPVVQIIAGVIWFLFNAWYMCLQFVDYPTDNNKISLKAVMALLKQKRWLSLGFGSGVLIFSMIPIVNLFVIPAAVAGATKLWAERYLPLCKRGIEGDFAAPQNPS